MATGSGSVPSSTPTLQIAADRTTQNIQPASMQSIVVNAPPDPVMQTFNDPFEAQGPNHPLMGPPSLLTTLQSNIRVVEDARLRIGDAIRVPAILVRPGSGTVGQDTSGMVGGMSMQMDNQMLDGLTSRSKLGNVSGMNITYVDKAFQKLESVRVSLKKPEIQSALKSAKESEELDPVGVVEGILGPNSRQLTTDPEDSSKIIQPPLEPAFVVPAGKSITSPFPVSLSESDKLPVTPWRLISYLQSYRQQHEHSPVVVRLWTGAKRPLLPGSQVQLTDPVILCAQLQNIVTVFIKLIYRPDEGEELKVESVVAVGPREKKGPYGRSDFTVYQKLTQEIARMVEMQPDVSLPQMLHLVSSYESLFAGKCSGCGRILSQEGHVPPVARTWREAPPTDGGAQTAHPTWEWDPRHIPCLPK